MRIPLTLLLASHATATITLDLNSEDSIKSAASTVAYDMMSYYTGNKTGDTPGNLPMPYYWWECGAMMGSMINYWYYTGDSSYNAAVKQALLHQTGDEDDFMPENQTKALGNDDQGFWGLAAMTAAETGFEDPDKDQPGWLSLAQGVFNTQVVRWDTTTCGGGFRWQIFTFNNGYGYKNSISNGCVFNLAARLALYTGNKTYADWAEKVWDWTSRVGLLDADFKVYDGTQNSDNCSEKDHNLWSYNQGIYLLGAAAMWNYTNGTSVWEARVRGMLNSSETFFVDEVMYEGCELLPKGCNVDQRSFKAYLARWMAATTKLVPWTKNEIMNLIQKSAIAAVKTCTATVGSRATNCGLNWRTGSNDGSLGVGEQMAALEIIQSNLVGGARGWVSDVKGTGTSVGNVHAGSGDFNKHGNVKDDRVITTGDRIAAGVVTGAVVLGVLGGSTVMLMGG